MGVDYGFKPQSGKNQGLQNCSNHSSLEWSRLWIQTPSQVKTKDYKIVVIILAWNGVDYGFKPQSGKNQGL